MISVSAQTAAPPGEHPKLCPYTGWPIYTFEAKDGEGETGLVFEMAVPPGETVERMVDKMATFFNGAGGANYRVTRARASERSTRLALLVDPGARDLRVEIAPSFSVGVKVRG
jgi:hypothetical protein